MTVIPGTILVVLSFVLMLANPHSAEAAEASILSESTRQSLWAGSPADKPAPGVVRPDDFNMIFTGGVELQAVQLVQEERFAEARQLLLDNAASVTATRPDETAFLLAWTCFNSDDWLCVISVVPELAGRLSFVSDHLALMYGIAMRETGHLEEALASLGRIPDASPLSGQALSIRIEMLVKADRNRDAEKLLSEYLQKNDPAAEVLEQIAESMIGSGRDSPAMQQLIRELEGTTGSRRGGLSGLLSRLGFGSEGPGRNTMLQAWAYLNAHDNKRALKAAEPMLDSADRAARCEAAEIAARANTKLRVHPEAFKHFRFLVNECRRHRDMPPILYLGIRSAYRSNNPGIGDEWTRLLADEYPDASYNDDIAVIRARTAIDAGRDEEAMAILEESVKRWPDGDMSNESRWLLAWSSFRKSRWDDAAARFAKAQTLTGGDQLYSSMFMYWNARALLKSGDTAGAIEAWRKCAVNWPMTYYAILSLNRLAEILNKTADEVLDDLDRDFPERRLRGRPFLTLGTDKRGGIDRATSGARALWFKRIGLDELARSEIEDAPGDDATAAWMKALFLYDAGQFTPAHRAARDQLLVTPFWPDSSSAGYYRLSYPRPFADEVNAAAAEFGVDAALIWGVMRQESAFLPSVESWANAAGLMQLIMSTAETMGRAIGVKVTRQVLNDPAVNVRLGAVYLARLQKRLKNPLIAIPAYNAGGGAMARWLKASGATEIDVFVESIPASEARGYARKVFESYSAYSFVYGDNPFNVMDVDFLTVQLENPDQPVATED
ncbi:MAG TPA: transglycosylase SLT domain-containing protein [Myxococcota bacterium]|nr:transglycosylase SLT domain-containing protein [Myxococcota bacterium]